MLQRLQQRAAQRRGAPAANRTTLRHALVWQPYWQPPLWLVGNPRERQSTRSARRRRRRTREDRRRGLWPPEMVLGRLDTECFQLRGQTLHGWHRVQLVQGRAASSARQTCGHSAVGVASGTARGIPHTLACSAAASRDRVRRRLGQFSASILLSQVGVYTHQDWLATVALNW